MKKYLVGGAVRDELMNVESNDRDYVVVGTTEQEMLEAGYKNVGAAFPVFLHPDTGEEYALARKEKKVGVGYTGFAVKFDPSITLEEDLSRRDLTINAIAKDLDTMEYIDPFGGRDDLHNKMLRHVSDAFAEDPLRVIRLARFYARFDDFKIHRDTAALAKELVSSGELNTLSYERFWAEMEKMFDQSSAPLRFFIALWNVGAIHKVDFFRDVFGQVGRARMEQEVTTVCKFITKAPKEDRVAYFVALTASNDAAQSGTACPVRISKLTKNIQSIRNMKDATPEMVFNFISMNRGWGNDPKALNDVIGAMKFAEMTGEVFPIASSVLKKCADAGHYVTMFDLEIPDLPAKEIGAAMAAERLVRVTETMKEDMKANKETTMFRVLTGSHLYGNATEKSDFDYKAVVLPPLDMLLANIKVSNRKEKPEGTGAGDKMVAGETETEYLPIQVFFEDFFAGQTYALELAFAAAQGVHESFDDRGNKSATLHTLHREMMQEMIDKFLTKNVKKMVGYAVSQSKLYGLKTERFATVKEAVKQCQKFCKHADMLEVTIGSEEADPLRDALLHLKYVKLSQIANGSGGTNLAPALDVCGKQYSFTNKVGTMLTSLYHTLDNYGERVASFEGEGVDWKALSHAIRITEQVLELCETGKLVFPRSTARALASVKSGKMPLDEATAYLDTVFSKLDDAINTSVLPERTEELEDAFANWKNLKLKELYAEQAAKFFKD